MESLTSQAPFYIAVLLYESSSPDPSYTPTFEECFVLVRAPSDDEARARAQQHSTSRQTSFQNAAGQLIHWKLKHIVDVSKILADALDDGSDIYARHFKDYDSYHRFEPLLGGTLD